MKPQNAAAVFFDVSAAECKKRVANRPAHPSIPFGNYYNIILIIYLI